MNLKKLICVIGALICGIALAKPAPAQTGGENLHIYLMTFGPGDEIWERFGHNAIWVQDEAFGIGTAYNWGMFSFRQENFIKRFVQGRMLYWMQGFDPTLTINSYIYYNRSIYVQELNLTPQQRVDLAKFMQWNALEENKYYRYDYLRDNCSTRVRDAIDRVTGGAIRRALVPIETQNTYRSHTAALTYVDPIAYFGLMFGLGPRVDRHLTAWQETFIPMDLRKWIRTVKVRGPNGAEQPLVLEERTLFNAKNRPPVAEHEPRFMWLGFTAVGFIMGGLLMLLAIAARSYRAVNVLLAFLVGVWCLVVGLLGTILEFLWGFTDHIVTVGNENVLQANSLSLVLMVFAIAALLGKVWARRWAVWLALFVAGLSLLGFLIQVFPFFAQVNGVVIGLLMPVHGAVAYILWRRWRVTTQPAARP